MRFFIINTDYSKFLDHFYKTHPGLHKKSYEEQHAARMRTLFGTADFYSSHLRDLGHDAWDVIANMEPMQRQWAEEHNVTYQRPQRSLRFSRGFIPCFSRDNRASLFSILEAQIRFYRPDVLYCMAIELIGSDFLKRVRPYYRLAIGQHAAPHPEHDISEYDLMLSSLPNFVDYYRRKGMKSELFHLGFEPRILEKLSAGQKRHDIVFIGGLGGHHHESKSLLESLCRRYNTKVWGYGIEGLPADSPIRKSYMGLLWGKDMYQILRDARIGFNRHIDIAGDYANNMRLYETTGVGTLLLTDHKSNISGMFVPGREVITYREAEECIEQARYYLEHDQERGAVARAGQERTLREHTYNHRMQELADIVRKHT